MGAERDIGEVELRQATWEDYDFLYDLLKTAMREHVERIWVWDEHWQRERFERTFDPAENQIIVLHDVDTRRHEDEIFLARLYILPEYQGRGIGTQLIESLLVEARQEGLPVTLRVLTGNPAKRLYERLGFETVEEAVTHYMMKATPSSRKPARSDASNKP
jgi:ribosomal protein S18 acetylase RimI-like enzyme